MTTENIDIRIREDGSRVVKRNLENLDPAARKAASGVDFLKRALAFLGGAVAAREILRLVDTFGNLQNRLRSVGLEGSGLTAVYKELFQVANQTRSSVEGSVELYSRLALSSKELGVSQKQLIDFTKSLNQAIILSGASGQEAQAGLIQLSQGLASGTLRGDELRSVLEQLPAVADVIAKGLGVTRGQLRLLGEEGKISAQAVLKAFQEARGELNDRFAKTVPTLSQSFQVLSNTVLDYVGNVDQATGFSVTLSTAMTVLAGNLDLVVRGFAGLAAGPLLLGALALAAKAASAAVVALTAAIAANPLGALLVALTSAISLVVLFRDKISLGVDAVTTLGDYLRAAGEVAGAAFNSILNAASALFGPLATMVREWVGTWEFSLVGVMRASARAADSVVGVWSGAVRATVVIFEDLPGALADIFTQALNFILDRIGQFVNRAGALLNTVTEFAGLGSIAESVNLTFTNEHEGAARRLGTNIADAFTAGFESSNGAQRFVDDVISRAQEFGQARAEVERLAARHPAGASNVAGPPAAITDPKAAKEVERLRKQYESLLSQISPVEGAVMEMGRAKQFLFTLLKRGIITQAEYSKQLDNLSAYYRDALDPLGAVNREMDQQLKLLGMTAKEREVEAQFLQTTQQLRQQGVVLTEQESSALRAKLELMQRTNEQTQIQDQLLANSVGARASYVMQLEQINRLLASGTGGFGKGDAAVATADIARQAGLDIEGTQVAIDAQLEQFRRMYESIDQLRQKNLVDEQTAQALRVKVWSQQQGVMLQSANTFFGGLSQLQNSHSRKLAAIGKAAAIAQATIKTYESATSAYAAMAGIPYVGPALGAAAAAAAIAAGLANIQAIRSAPTGFRHGGYTGNGGLNAPAGIVHGQEFVVNADATARNRAALEAMNAGAQVGGGGAVIFEPRVIVNTLPGETADVRTRQGADGELEIEVAVRRVLVSDVREGGPIATQFERQYGLNRATGASY